MIFLDNASTTQVSLGCLNIFTKYQMDNFYNPSALYHQSLMLNREIKQAKEDILKTLRGNGNIIFTSSGTESNNLALFGSKKPNGARIIVSQSEHPAVYNTANELKQRGYDVVFCEVDSNGRVIEEEFIKLMNKDTCLVSIMHVNNETGCINDIKKLCSIAKSVNDKVIFHSDGVQAIGKIKVLLEDLGVDLYTISGHKIHAPKGVAGLFVKNRVNLKPILFGGGQEEGIRSSTENVGGILALANAIKESVVAQRESEAKIKEIREDLVKFFMEKDFIVSNSIAQSNYILCVAMKSVRGEVLLHALEKHGVLIGTGSACSSKKGVKRLPSILKLSDEYKNGIIRISFNCFTSKDDIEYFKNAFNLEYINLLKYVQ